MASGINWLKSLKSESDTVSAPQIETAGDMGSEADGIGWLKTLANNNGSPSANRDAYDSGVRGAYKVRQEKARDTYDSGVRNAYKTRQDEELNSFDPSRINPDSGVKSNVRYALDENYRNETGINAQNNGTQDYQNYLSELSNEEQQNLKRYALKDDWTGASNYLDSMTSELNRRRREASGKVITDFSEKSPGTAAFVNIITSPLTGLEYLPILAGGVKEAITGKKQDIDLNSITFSALQTAQDTQAGIDKAIENKLGTGKAGDTGKFLAGTGLSIGKNLVSLPFGGAGALASIGAQAAAQSGYNTLQRGGNAKQAALIGTANGVVEAVTEKIPLDNLFKIAGSAGKQGVKETLKTILKQAGTEATEEAISQVAQGIVDMAVMGEKSEFRQYSNQMQDEGLTKQQADMRALGKIYGTDVLTAAAGGALSGGILGGGASLLSRIGAGSPVGNIKNEDSGAFKTPESSQGVPGTIKTGSATEGEVTGRPKTSFNDSIVPQNVNRVNIQNNTDTAQKTSNIKEGAVPLKMREGGQLPTHGDNGINPPPAKTMPPSNTLGTVKAGFTAEGGITGRPGASLYEKPLKADRAENGPPLTSKTNDEQASLNKTVPQNVSGVNALNNADMKQAAPNIPIEGKTAAKAETQTVVNKVRSNISELNNMESVIKLTGQEFSRNENKKLSEQVIDFFKSLGNKVIRQEFGDVIIDKKSFQSDIAHGLGRTKAITFAAVPDVIANGKQIDYEPNWKGRGEDSYIFSAPVEINGQKTFVGAVVLKSKDNFFYLHEVVDSNGNIIYAKNDTAGVFKPPAVSPDADGTVQTGLTAQGGITGRPEASFIDTTIPQNVSGVNVQNSTDTVQRESNSVDSGALRTGNERTGDADPRPRDGINRQLGIGGASPVSLELGMPKNGLQQTSGTNQGKRVTASNTIPLNIGGVNAQRITGGALPSEIRAGGQLPTRGDNGINPPPAKAIPPALNNDISQSAGTVNDRSDSSPGASERSGILRKAEKSPLEIDNVKALLEEDGGVTDSNAGYDYAVGLAGDGISYAKDLSRNLDAAAGKNIKLRQTLREEVELPILKAKAQYAENVRSKLDELYQVTKRFGVKKGSKESAAVQWIGEGQRQDRYGELHEYTLEQLKEEFPQTWQSIVEAEKHSRKFYDDYVDSINGVLENIYPNALENAISRQRKFQNDEVFYREQAKVQENLKTRIAQDIDAKKAAMERKKDSSKVRADSQNSINYDTRRIKKIEEKAGKYLEMAERAKNTAKSIQSDIDSGDVLRNKRLTPRKDYYHHFQEIESGLEGLINLVSTPADIDARLSGLSEYTQPKTKWAGFMQERTGGKYKEDAIGGLLKYIPAAEYKINIDPVIAKGRAQIKGIAEATENTRNANKFLEWYTDYVNDLAGKTNPFDRPVQKIISRKGMNVLRTLNSRVKSNAVLGNVRSAVSQFFNIPNAAAYVKNPTDWVKGMKLYSDGLFGRQDANSLMKQSGFLNERYLDSSFSQFDEGLLKAPEKFANWLLSIGDKQATKLMDERL